MSLFTNQKTWFFIAMFFIVVNAVMIIGMFTHGRGHGRGRFRGNVENINPRRDFERMHGGSSFLHTKFIADTLGFNTEQRSKLEVIEKVMGEKRDSAMKVSEESKNNFTQELFSVQPNKNKLDSLSKIISQTTIAYNNIRIEKVFKIREICNKEQLEKFSVILSDMSKKRSRGHFNN